MKSAPLLILTFILIDFGVTAQDLSSFVNKRVRFTASAGFGQSTFAFNIPSPSKFTTPEFRLGLGIIKPIGKFVDLRSGICFGAKMKREPFNKYAPQGFLIVTTPPAFMNADELSSKRNHYFIDSSTPSSSF